MILIYSHMRKCLALLLVLLLASGMSASIKGPVHKPVKGVKKMAAPSMMIKSPLFKNMEKLPVKYTGDGDGVSPALVFENVPANTKSLALIMDDPDAPAGTFDHWLIFDIPPSVKEIKEGTTPAGAVMGKNSAGRTNYVPPYPPAGNPHRYVFNLYALDKTLFLMEGDDKFRIMSAMEGHIIAHATLIGLHKR